MKYQVRNCETGAIESSATTLLHMSPTARKLFDRMLEECEDSIVYQGYEYLIFRGSNNLEIWNNLPRFPRYQVSDCGSMVRNKVTLRTLKPNANKQVKLVTAEGHQKLVITHHLLSEIE